MTKPADTVSNFIRSFGRRRTKGLRSTRANAMDDVLAKYRIALPDMVMDSQQFFSDPVTAVWLEIGFGNGEHLVQQAEVNPTIGMIGCEPFMNGVAAMCVPIQKQDIKNIRIWHDDARLLMEKIKPQSLDKIFLLHPDPWPKVRHHKRRFVQTETLDMIAGLLKTGGEFLTATDHPDLAEWIKDKTLAHPAFRLVEEGSNENPETRYGIKGIAAGRPSVYFRFRKNKA